MDLVAESTDLQSFSAFVNVGHECIQRFVLAQRNTLVKLDLEGPGIKLDNCDREEM